jgi:hypothetical protein
LDAAAYDPCFTGRLNREGRDYFDFVAFFSSLTMLAKRR